MSRPELPAAAAVDAPRTDDTHVDDAATSVAPVLTDGVVTLRAHDLGDVDALLEQCTDPEMLRFTTVPHGYTREMAVDRVAQVRADWQQPGADRSWAIEWTPEGGSPRYAGTVDLRPGESPATASLGFALHPAARGHGLMARAVRLVARFAFDTRPWGVPVTRLHWRAVVGNWGSRRVAWACGFTFHGSLPQTHVDPADRTGPALDAWHASLGPDDALAPGAPWVVPPVLDGDGIRLRPWRDDDGAALEPRGDDPQHWMPGRSVLSAATFATWLTVRRERMSLGQAVEWCVADASTDRALGSVVLFSRDGAIGDTAELGYQLNPGARGRGVATQAARLAVAYALRAEGDGGLGCGRLVAETAADNAASNRVLESAGFTVFGRERKVDRLADGSWGDGLHWELVPPTR
jgi:RimJ/RimL family protein N-acetyltransferase